MHSRNNIIHAENQIGEFCYIHAENQIGEFCYELNCSFAAEYLYLTCRDIGKGREQDAEALPIGT